MATKTVRIGGVTIGNGNKIAIQSMTKTDTRDIEATVRQISALKEEGCDIVRVAVPDMEAAAAIKEIKKHVNIPVVADIHYDYRLAIESIRNGIDKLRINPGNIGSEANVKLVADAAKANGVPIRVGVNSGSLEKDILHKYGGVTPEGLVESALRHVRILENQGFYDIVIAIKASSVLHTIAAYTATASIVDYPLHLGVTESGTLLSGSIKSAIGIGSLLAQGIGDTIRVSLTEDPVLEVKCAKEILKALGLTDNGVRIVSCPTCGRTQIDLITLAKSVEERTKNIQKNIKIAVMGCVVNGPGESREADYGIAGGKGVGIIFKKGEIIKKVHESELLDELMILIDEA